MPQKDRIGSEEIRAKVITQIALEPKVHSQSTLSELIGRKIRADVSRAVRWYVQLGWVETNVPYPIKGIGQRQQLQTKPQFWTDFNEIVQGLRLPPNDFQLFASALQERKAMEGFLPGSAERDFAHANYLGRAALLGERHDLSREAGWMRGAPGWASLITIQTLGKR